MSSEIKLRLHRDCFTGHSQKLNQSEKTIVTKLEREIRVAVDIGFVIYISGMARGVDIWGTTTPDLRRPILRL